MVVTRRREAMSITSIVRPSEPGGPRPSRRRSARRPSCRPGRRRPRGRSPRSASTVATWRPATGSMIPSVWSPLFATSSGLRRQASRRREPPPGHRRQRDQNDGSRSQHACLLLLVRGTRVPITRRPFGAACRPRSTGRVRRRGICRLGAEIAVSLGRRPETALGMTAANEHAFPEAFPPSRPRGPRPAEVSETAGHCPGRPAFHAGRATRDDIYWIPISRRR